MKANIEYICIDFYKTLFVNVKIDHNLIRRELWLKKVKDIPIRT